MMTSIKVKFRPSTVDGKEGVSVLDTDNKNRRRFQKMEYWILDGNYYNGSGGYGWAEIDSDITFAEITVNSGGYLQVVSGGTVYSTMVNSGGWMSVSEGGSANRTTVNSGGLMYVYTGGSADRITVNSGGHLSINDGGTATNIDWTPCVGYVYVQDGGSVSFVNPLSGVYFGSGNCLLSSATVMYGKTVPGHGQFYVMSGGTAINTTVKGNMEVWSGGTAYNTMLYDDLDVFSGGLVSGVNVYDGELDLHGGSALAVTVFSGGEVELDSNAYLSNATISFGGEIDDLVPSASISGVKVLAGGMVNEFTLQNAVTLDNASFALSNAVVTSKKSGRVYEGQSINGVTVKNGGNISHVADLASVTNITVEAGGTIGGFSFGNQTVMLADLSHLSNVRVKATGNNYGNNASVFAGQTVSDATVESGCRLTICGGGTTVSNVTLEEEASCNVEFDLRGRTAADDCSISGLSTIQSYQYYYNNYITIHVDADQAEGCYVLTDEVFDCSSVNLIVWNGNTGYSQGFYTGYSQGFYSDTVTYGSNTYIAACSEADGLMLMVYRGLVNSTYDVESGYTATDIAVNYGSIMNVMDGGTADNTTVNPCGSLTVFSGGTANNIVENGGYVWVDDEAVVTFSPNVFSGVVLDDWNSATVHSGTTANNTTVNYGNLVVHSGGTANSTTVNSCGSLYVSSGGTANETTVNSGGYLDVNDGGTADNTTVNEFGYLEVFSGGTADRTTVNQSGYLSVLFGGTADNTTVISGGYLDVFGGTAQNIIIENGGYVSVYSGTVDNTTVNQSGYLDVFGTAQNIIENGGYVWIDDNATATFTPNVLSGMVLNNCATVHSGTTAINTTVNCGLEVYDGGSANNTTVNSLGELLVYSGGTANNTTVNDMGQLFVYSGGTANNTTVNSGGYLFVDGNMANLNSGSLDVSSGCTANLTTVNSGGTMNVPLGGTANNTTVNSGGTLYVAGGKLTGNLEIASGATVSAYEGSIIDFDISEFIGCSTARVNDLSLIQGTPSYTITVSANQAAGVYTLAGGADGFTETVSIGTDESNYGTLTVNGAALNIGDYTFVLTTSDSSLLLSVENPYTISGLVLENSTYNVESGYTTMDTTVNAGGTLNVMDGAQTNNTVINNGGATVLSSGAFADRTTVNWGGGLHVSGNLVLGRLANGRTDSG